METETTMKSTSEDNKHCIAKNCNLPDAKISGSSVNGSGVLKCPSSVSNSSIIEVGGVVHSSLPQPQSEIVWNKHLPYADLMDDEAEQQFACIKINLAKAVISAQFEPTALYWTRRLLYFISINGYKFCKSDHINLVKLMYEIVTTDYRSIRPYSLLVFMKALYVLLKKRKLLSRDDLQLRWKPVVTMYESCMDNSIMEYGLYRAPIELSATFSDMTNSCRAHFTLDATSELLDKYKPLLLPYTKEEPKESLSCLSLFLPTDLPPELHQHTLNHCFEEFLSLWLNTNQVSLWDSEIMITMASAAWNNIGYINWKPYQTRIMTRLFRTLALPGITTSFSEDVESVILAQGDMHTIVVLVVSMMGGDNTNTVMPLVERFFSAITSYYHPSNSGDRSSDTLGPLLYLFPEILVHRLHRERFQELCWETPIPESHHMRAEEVDCFVKAIKPALHLATFHKYDFVKNYASKCWHELALIRPQMVIGELLECFNTSFDRLLEPHRLTDMMETLAGVARSLLNREDKESRLAVFQILLSIIPGIDYNDLEKCYCTLGLITAFSLYLPFVDSSKVGENLQLSDDEREVCLQTRNFQQFLEELLDQCFTLVENCREMQAHGCQPATDNEQLLTTEESQLQTHIYSALNNVFIQCSSTLFLVAMNKLDNFVRNRVMETNVAGRLVAAMLRAAARANCELATKALLPHLLKTILKLAEKESNLVDEHVDDDFLWNLQMAASLATGDGTVILKYKNELMDVLNATVMMKCKRGYTLALYLLIHLLKSLVRIYPMNPCSVDAEFSMPDFVSVHHWGKHGDIDNLGIQWHIPNAEEVKFAQILIYSFVMPQMEAFQRIVDGKEVIDKDVLLQRLDILKHCLLGASIMLPLWKGSSEDEESDNMSGHVDYITSVSRDIITAPNGGNVREMMAVSLTNLANYLLKQHEDDTKSLQVICDLFTVLLHVRGEQIGTIEHAFNLYKKTKRAMEDRLVKQKKHARLLLISRVYYQHMKRTVIFPGQTLTNLHKTVLLTLFQLSISRYAIVRQKAQRVLKFVMNAFPGSTDVILPELTGLLVNGEVQHEVLKGALYLISELSTNEIAPLILDNLKACHDILPAVVENISSERQSITGLLNRVLDTLDDVQTIPIAISVSEKSKAAASSLLIDSINSVDILKLQEDEEKRIKEITAENTSLYTSLMNKLAQLALHGQLPFLNEQLLHTILNVMIRDDILVPVSIIQTCLSALTHDTPDIRRLALHNMSGILKQLRVQRPKEKISVDPYAIASCQQPIICRPGHRPDNMSVLYDEKKLPLSEELFEEKRFYHKLTPGFYCWPKQLTYNVASNKQHPLLDQSDFNPQEATIANFFSDEHHISCLIRCLALEQDVETDVFDRDKFDMFKGLFRTFGDRFLGVLEPHLQKMAVNTDQVEQRCAAEIIAAMIRGSKHWNFGMIKRLEKCLGPLLQKVLLSITQETQRDWKACVSWSFDRMDPNKISWLFHVLMESSDPFSEVHGSSLIACRVEMLANCLFRQQWRVPHLMQETLKMIKPHLAHEFHDVRVAIAVLLRTIFCCETNLPNQAELLNPSRSAFVEDISPMLEQLKVSDNDEKHKEIIRIYHTYMKWLVCEQSSSMHPAPLYFMKLLPFLCLLDTETEQEDIRKDMKWLLALMAGSLLNCGDISAVIDILKSISTSTHWHSRLLMLEYLKVMVFANFFVVTERAHIKSILHIVESLLEDCNTEVREQAGDTLSCLIHWGTITPDKTLLLRFKELAQTKIIRKRRASGTPTSQPGNENGMALAKRHAGVLGLCASLTAHPYDVPSFMPDVLVKLSTHMHDPIPISVTVKKTVSEFWRTHTDMWHLQRKLFSEEQLAVISNLLVSPSYYA